MCVKYVNYNNTRNNIKVAHLCLFSVLESQDLFINNKCKQSALIVNFKF